MYDYVEFFYSIEFIVDGNKPRFVKKEYINQVISFPFMAI